MLNDTLLSIMIWGNANEIVYGLDTFLYILYQSYNATRKWLDFHNLGEIEESHVMDTIKGYLTQRSVMRIAFVLSINLFKTSSFIWYTFIHFTSVSVHILVNRCTQNVGSRTLLYLQELTSLIRNLILFDIAENMSKINLNEFVRLMLL